MPLIPQFYLIVTFLTVLFTKSSSFKITFHNSVGNLINFKNQNVLFMRLESKNYNYWIKLAAYELPFLPNVTYISSNGTETLSSYSKKSVKSCMFKAETYLLRNKHIHVSDDNNKQYQFELRLFNKSSRTEHFKELPSLNNTAPYLMNVCNNISGFLPYVKDTRNFRVQIRSISKTIKVDWIEEDIDEDFVFKTDFAKNLLRKKRSDSAHITTNDKFGGPYIVELGVSIRYEVSQYEFGGDTQRLLSLLVGAMSLVNLVFSRFNIHIIIVRIDLFERNGMKNSGNDDKVLWARKSLITPRMDCGLGLVPPKDNVRAGVSDKGKMCSFSECYSYVQVHKHINMEELAHVISHELGHSFGLSHDNELCKCQGCIMGYGIGYSGRTLGWSRCSIRDMYTLLHSDMSVCLFDYPETTNEKIPLYQRNFQKIKYKGNVQISSICGNGVLELGEQCDCGGEKRCTKKQLKCCSGTCTLIGNAKCAMGTCCDLDTCQLKPAGTLCRGKDPGYIPILHQEGCDLPEFCNGTSEWCPRDYYKQNGVPCTVPITSERARCYHGKCATRLTRCQMFYGKEAKVASPKCNQLNHYRKKIGSKLNNCGIYFDNFSRDTHITNYYIRNCKTVEQMMCGRNWCNEWSEYPLVRLVYKYEIYKHKEEYCSGIQMFMDNYNDDLGLVPNYQDCGPNKMCFKGTCQFKSLLLSDLCHCNGKGVCHDKKSCYCDVGYAPPYCNTTGYGGSLISGPPSQSINASILAWILFVLFLLVILIFMALAIGILTYHYQKKVWPPFIVKMQNKYYNSNETPATTYVQSPRGIYMARSPEPKSNAFFGREESIYVSYKPKIPAFYKPNRPISPESSLVKDKARLFEQDEKKILLPPTFKRQIPPKIPKKPQLGRLNISQPEHDSFASKRSSSLSNILSPGQFNLNTSLRPASKIKPRSPIRSPPPQFSPEIIIKPLPKPKVSTKPQINPNIALKVSKFSDTPVVSPSSKPLIPRDKPKSEIRVQSPPRPPSITIKPSLSHTKPTGDQPNIQPLLTSPHKPVKPPPRLPTKPTSPPAPLIPTTKPSSSSSITTIPPAKLPKSLKRNLISAPKLEETTCDYATRDLTKTDDNLKREIGPHLLRKVNPNNAHKYMK